MRGGHLFEKYKGLLSFEIMYAQKWGYKNDVYADFMWKTGEVYDIQKSEDKFVQNS